MTYEAVDKSRGNKMIMNHNVSGNVEDEMIHVMWIPSGAPLIHSHNCMILMNFPHQCDLCSQEVVYHVCRHTYEKHSKVWVQTGSDSDVNDQFLCMSGYIRFDITFMVSANIFLCVLKKWASIQPSKTIHRD